MIRHSTLGKILILAAPALLLASSACPGGRVDRGNIVLVTITSLRADRLTGPVPSVDPFASLREAAGASGLRVVLASSSETLPSLATLFTGTSPAGHATLVEGLDRLPESMPTLAERLAAAGYRTGGFPSLVSLGLSSGLSRGFQAYGWPPQDLVSRSSVTATDQQGWVLEVGRRQGLATVKDALRWAEQHRKDRMFLWVHLADASPPYSTDRALIAAYPGSTYDAAMAYEDLCFKTLRNGFAGLGLSERTTFLVAGDHGESLGENGEWFHGLNLYPAALETVVAVIPAKGVAGPGAGKPRTGGPGRIEDLFATILELAGADAAGKDAGTDLPDVTAARPLLAVTLGPRSAFGWEGRLALFDGEWIWTGPESEELFKPGDAPKQVAERPLADAERARAMRQRALADAAPIAKRLTGRRPPLPSLEDRTRIVSLLRSAASARESGSQEGELSALREAWKIDPGNFEVAQWLTQANGPASGENPSLAREVESRGGDMPEALLALSRMNFETLARACQIGGSGCTIDLALRQGRSGKFEEAAKTLAPVAEKAADADLWRTLGDLFFAVENIYRAGQAYEKASVLRPGDPDILLRQGDCLAALRDYKGAKIKYGAARTALPDAAVVEMRLGSLARQQGDRAAALEHFRKGVGVDVNTAAGSIALGRVLAEQGMTAEAITLFLDASARDTSSADGLYHAAEAYAAEGKLDEAEKSLRGALERSPGSAATIYQLARLLVYRGDREGAGKQLERLAATSSTEIAVAALKDPLFANEAPGSPLLKALQSLYEMVKRAAPEGGGLSIVGDPPAARNPAAAPSRP